MITGGFVIAAAFLCLLGETSGFLAVGRRLPLVATTCDTQQPAMSTSDTTEEVDIDSQARSAEAAKFKILTCTSTTCAKKRKVFMMDEYATFGAFFARSKEAGGEVLVEESPCLGSCKKAPCVAIAHEDYEGTVALEGMTDDEFGASW